MSQLFIDLIIALAVLAGSLTIVSMPTKEERRKK